MARCLLLRRMGFAVLRIVKAGRKQAEREHRMGLLVAGFDRLLLLRMDSICLRVHRKLKAVRSLLMAVVLLERNHWVALLLRRKDWR